MMRNRIIFSSAAILTGWALLTSGRLDPSNPPVASTGAPSEQTCAKSGCHSGGTYAGTVELTGVPDTIAASTTYNLTVKNASNAVRGGFQLTVLDGANAFAGTLTQATGVSIGTSNTTGRKYARQSTPKTLSGGSTSWTFQWKSPATLSGNKATFYFVSLCANGNGKESGDNVLKATKEVKLASTVAAAEPIAAQQAVKIYPTAASDVLHIDLEGAQKGTAQIFSMDGKPMFSAALSARNALSIDQLPPGAYVARVQAGSKIETKKFIRE